MKFDPLEHPVCLEFPAWLAETAWAEHVPFAMFLMSAARPRTFVELGTFRGVSYCAFCQAARAIALDAACTAIDTWEGDEHAGFLEEGVLTKLQKHHDPLYSTFSRLLRSTFDEALIEFDNGSIDLLHIDGFHSYEAVRHDFDSWLPRMSSRGIVLFHDTSERESGFGVWKFWDEVCKIFPNFAFEHGHGLGVLSVGTEIAEDLKFLFETDEKQTELIKKFFRELGRRVDERVINMRQNEYINHLKTHEKVVMDSKLMRVYRIIRFEGLGSLWRKVRKL
jgi:hypothetical protein